MQDFAIVVIVELDLPPLDVVYDSRFVNSALNMNE